VDGRLSTIRRRYGCTACEALAARRRVVESERAGLCQIRIKNRWFANPAWSCIAELQEPAIVAMPVPLQSAVMTLRQPGVAAIFAQARAGSRERRQHIAADTVPGTILFAAQATLSLTIRPFFNGFGRRRFIFRQHFFQACNA